MKLKDLMKQIDQKSKDGLRPVDPNAGWIADMMRQLDEAIAFEQQLMNRWAKELLNEAGGGLMKYQLTDDVGIIVIPELFDSPEAARQHVLDFYRDAEPNEDMFRNWSITLVTVGAKE